MLLLMLSDDVDSTRSVKLDPSRLSELSEAAGEDVRVLLDECESLGWIVKSGCLSDGTTMVHLKQKAPIMPLT